MLTFDTIKDKIKELEDEKNISNIIKKYNKINSDIKVLNTEILNLKKEFEEIGEDKEEEIGEETFKKYSEEISDDKINKILDEVNLKLQMDEYKKIILKINACKKFLESKKMNITECDKNDTQKQTKTKIQFNPKKKTTSKNKKYSSSSNSEISSDSD
jgi:hypothetical protein